MHVTRSDVPGQLQRPIATSLVAWLAMIGVDLFLHAGLLAPLYDWSSPFLLSPEDAFLRIPAGYLAFLMLAGGLAWLLPRLGVESARRGALVGGAGGAVVWGALLLGLWSISSAAPAMLGAWWIGQSGQMAVGGYLIGAALGGRRVRSVAAWSISAVVLGLVAAIALQSIGYAPVPVLVPT